MMDKSVVRIPENFKDHPMFNSLICGTNFGFMSRRGYYDTEFAQKQPELMRQMGINWTTLNMNICQETFYSTKLFLDFEFSSGEAELIGMTEKLHANGVRVILKPCLTCLDGAAMACVLFPAKCNLSQIQGVETDYWGKWFDSYKKCIRYCAQFAEKAKVDSLMIGAELLGTEEEDEKWREVIQVVRSVYSGPISYEITPESARLHKLEWLNELDYISYSYYPPAAAPNMTPFDTYNRDSRNMPDKTAEEMTAYMQPAKEGLSELCRRFSNMPVAFTEVGTRSCHGSIMLPYNILWDSYYDAEEQANYMEAIFRTFSENPYWMGLFWWKWDETQNRPHYHDDPAGEKGFTIQGKPAEAVMRRWFEKCKD